MSEIHEAAIEKFMAHIKLEFPQIQIEVDYCEADNTYILWHNYKRHKEIEFIQWNLFLIETIFENQGFYNIGFSYSSKVKGRDAASDTVGNFGTVIKDLRKENGITQRALAERVGVDFTYISKMENGKLDNFPSIEVIIKMAQVLKSDPDELTLLAKKIPNKLRKAIFDDELVATLLQKVSTMTPGQRKKIQDYIDDLGD